jgi:hypothetical protein
VLALAALVAGGCGKSKSVPSPQAKAAPDPARAAGGGTTLYQGGSWAVVTRGAQAVALRLVGDHWRPDRTRRVRIRILGPQPGARAARTPQVAIELVAPGRLAESGLWVDGKELLVKGGGSPTRGTIYGAPDAPLAPGRHVAVGFARTASTGTAVAWAFDV